MGRTAAKIPGMGNLGLGKRELLASKKGRIEG